MSEEKRKKKKEKSQPTVDQSKSKKSKISEIDELKSLLQRTQADFVNFKKRTEAGKIELIKYANIQSLLRIIPVLDNFKRASEHVPKEIEDSEWVEGVKQIEVQFEETLKQEGLERIETVGKEFNHDEHEAISFEEGEKDGEIVKEVETGYKIEDKVIKPAKVIVTKSN